eukprot:5345916-Pyramimonas_sp.AAC.1
MYRNAFIVVSFRGNRSHGFVLARGMKQGCHMSGPLFALAYDPIIRMLANKLPPPMREVGAFADDCGLGSCDVSAAFPIAIDVWVLAGKAL